MHGIFLEPLSRVLVLLHALFAMALIGSSTHHVIVALGYVRGRARPRLGRIYALVSAAAYSLTFLVGALAYPTFRYRVRGLYLDHYAVWASKLWEIKETFATIGLSLAVAVLILSRVMDPKADGSLTRTYLVMVSATAAIVWFNVVSGLLVTLVKGV